MDRKVGRPQSRSVRHEEIKILALPGLELLPLCSSARIQSLYRLRYPSHIQYLTPRKIKELSERFLTEYPQSHNIEC
jgi:hypothetical protein